jgi:PAS domain-containing protein
MSSAFGGGHTRTMPQSSSISDGVRRWTWTVGQLRTRAQRAKGRFATDPAAAETIVDEALEVCGNLLVDLAGGDAEIKKLRVALQQEQQDALSLFERIPAASVATDAAGLITAANRDAALLLNVSARHLAGKPLLHFTQNRSAFLALLGSLPRDGSTSRGAIAIRPRERRTMTVDVAIVPRTTMGATEWLWFLTPESAGDRAVVRDPLEVPTDGDSAESSHAVGS